MIKEGIEVKQYGNGQIVSFDGTIQYLLSIGKYNEACDVCRIKIERDIDKIFEIPSITKILFWPEYKLIDIQSFQRDWDKRYSLNIHRLKINI